MGLPGEAAVTITLKQAYEQGSIRIEFQCFRPIERAPNGLCGKTGSMSMETAIRRWGGSRLLDTLPARCSRCHSTDFVSASGQPPGRIGKRGRR